MKSAGRGNIAVFSVGAIGTGEFGEGIPALVDTLRVVAQRHPVTVYSLLRADRSNVPAGIVLRDLPFRTPLLRVDLLLLAVLFAVDHLRHRYTHLHAVAAYPMGSLANALSGLFRIPSLISLQGQELANLPQYEFGDLRSPTGQRRIAGACRRADALTALSRFQASALKEIGYAPGSVEVVPFGIDTSRFNYVEKKLDSPVVFLHVGYAHPVKDIESVLTTFRLVQLEVRSRLIIVGQSHRGGPAERRIRELGLAESVEIAGSMRQADLVDCYDRSHFLLQASRYESQGVVFNEAMASGTVVCSTRVGLADDIGDIACIVANIGDAEGLARKILQVIADEPRYAELRRSGHAWAVEHDAHWTAAQYERIYARLARAGGRVSAGD